MTSYRGVGGRLGAYIRATNPNTQQIQGFLSDLLVGDELLPTMREVASRPSFLMLQGLAGSGKGTIQRDALLEELSRRYLPVVIDEVNELINGMLDLKQESSGIRTENKQERLESPDQEPNDPWARTESLSTQNDINMKNLPEIETNPKRQLTSSEICDETLWNTQRDPDTDARFLKAWNLRWFNKRYRPRLERD